MADWPDDRLVRSHESDNQPPIPTTPNASAMIASSGNTGYAAANG